MGIDFVFVRHDSAIQMYLMALAAPSVRVKKKDSYAESHKNSKNCVLMTDLGLIVLACFSPQTAKFYLKSAVVTTKFGKNLAVSGGHFQNNYT